MDTDSRVFFNNLSEKFSQLLYGRTEGDRNLINKTLDDLNTIDYRHPVITNITKAVLLVNQCCSLVSPDDSFLVAKCCQLITNLVTCQNVQIEGRTLTVAIRWCLTAVKQSEDIVTIDILHTIDGLLRSNLQCVYPLIQEIITSNSSIVLLAQNELKPEVVLTATRCLEACTIIPNHLEKDDKSYWPQLEICTNIFLSYLVGERNIKFTDFLYYKLLISCIKGLQNIITQNENFLSKELNILLGIAKSYMVYGIKDVDFIKPVKIMPSPLSIPEPACNLLREKKGGKVTKQRKQRTSNKKDTKRTESDREWTSTQYNTYIPAAMRLGLSTDNTMNSVMTTNRLMTSDSDFSDSERCVVAKLSIIECRIRQAALNLLFNIVKFTDKRTIFSYWSSFIPDGSPSGQHNLATCILKDPSPKGRMAALNVLLSLLSSSKLYLSQAEYSDKSTSFTPFSVFLGSMIQELHWCLRLALNENSIPVLTQVLKCFAGLVQATPYHRLSPGMITKVIRNVKVFIDHRDASIQVTALIVLGCVLASEPLMPETVNILLKNQALNQPEEDLTSNEIKNCTEGPDFDYVTMSSDDDELEPSYNETEMPWLLQRCLRNLGVIIDQKNSSQAEVLIPAPVKLESLQVISAMTRNYFAKLIAPYLHHVSKALELSLLDKYTDMKLHAGRSLDFIGQAMTQYFANNVNKDELTVERGLTFWNNLIKQPLNELIQCEKHPTLRAVGCDCLGSIGPVIFEHLSTEKQISIITLLLGCSNDEENTVKGAAVRALAICVLYPSLREDLGFVIDTAETIYRILKDENMTVRIKASWSLANLSDALVLIRNDPNIQEEIPTDLLLKLIEASIKGSSDNDKIKTSTVRALGNFLQLITPELIYDAKFKNISGQAINTLVKNSITGAHMKVRWNACYAIGSILKNDALYLFPHTWQNSVYKSLTDLVTNFHNFKVRINAALALSCPINRNQYGEFYYLTWISLMKALENSQNMEDFSEYKHRDHLIEQICLSIGHLTMFLTVDDLNALQDSVSFYSDVMASHMHRVYERMVPEKSCCLFTANLHIQTLAAENLTLSQRETLEHLNKVFYNDL